MTYENFDNVNAVLKHLYDSVNGLNECAKQTESTGFAQTLLSIENERKQFIYEIKSTIHLTDQSFSDQGSMVGPLHRLIIDLKSLITNKDIISINNEIKRGDEVLVDSYRTAIEAETNQGYKTLLIRQLSKIEKNLIQIDVAALSIVI